MNVLSPTLVGNRLHVRPLALCSGIAGPKVPGHEYLTQWRLSATAGNEWEEFLRGLWRLLLPLYVLRIML